jgi:predicted N-formylglutamate amidohydrolase
MKKIILSCEHGGAQIPTAYKKLFADHSKILKTHRALDIGALNVAKDLQKILKTPFKFSVISRLVIDLNRFVNSRTLFSEFTKSLSKREKSIILKKYYHPYWKEMSKILSGLVLKKHQVFHIAVHSMTDKLHKKSRPMQLALLYDPKRQVEKKFANLWFKELQQEFPTFKITRNNPYKGSGSGITSYFRKIFKEKNYIGIELEINQGYLTTLKNQQERKHLSSAIAESLQQAVNNFK